MFKPPRPAFHSLLPLRALLVLGLFLLGSMASAGPPRPKPGPTVLVFVLHDCPICNAYMPELNRIIAEYAPRGARFRLVYSEARLTARAMRAHAREYGVRAVTQLDSSRALARKMGATIAPEVVVLGADGKTVYRGRIDDLYVAPGKRRPRATTHDLRDALDAILANRPVPKPTTEPVGCYISRAAVAPIALT